LKNISSFRELKIKEGFVIIHSNLVPILKKKFNLKKFWKNLHKSIGKNKTILMPTFTFDLRSSDTWDYSKTPSQTGILTEYFRKKISTRRTIHPIHSLAIFGPKEKKVPDHYCKSSFGKGSTWEWLALNKNVCNLSIGIGLDGGATICHYPEEKAKVPYRKYIKLPIFVRKKNKKIVKKNFTYFARMKNKSFEGINNWKTCEKDLINEGIINRFKTNDGLLIQKMNAYETTKFISNKLKKNIYYLGNTKKYKKK